MFQTLAIPLQFIIWPQTVLSTVLLACPNLWYFSYEFWKLFLVRFSLYLFQFSFSAPLNSYDFQPINVPRTYRVGAFTLLFTRFVWAPAEPLTAPFTTDNSEYCWSHSLNLTSPSACAPRIFLWFSKAPLHLGTLPPNSFSSQGGQCKC